MKVSQFSQALFQPDIFSSQEPHFLPVEKSQNLELVLRYFSKRLGQVKIIHQPMPVCQNSRVFLIQSSNGQFVLKGIAQEENPDAASLSRHLQFMDRARLAGIPFARIHPTDAGDWIVTDQRRYFYLMDFVNGQARYLGDEEQALLSVAHSIGDLFAYLRSDHGPQAAFLERKYFEPEEVHSLASFERTLERGEENLPIDGDPLKEYCQNFRKEYEKIRSEFQKQEWGLSQLSHIDLHPHNILVKRLKVVCFLDLESIRPGNPTALIGYATFKLLRNFVALRKSKDPHISPRQIQGIRNHFIAELIRSGGIAEEEVRLLSLGAQAENMKRLLNIFKNADQKKKWGDRFRIFSNALAGEIDWIFNRGDSLQ